jgi:RNase adaptor protein for sRNA GlmZ degradation
MPGHPQIYIKSFGFLVSGIPSDNSGHGGGFVFDCRGLPNPGREIRYRCLTGQDQAVIDYLANFAEVKAFIEHAYFLIVMTAASFQKRNFSYLAVNFGCTGGQHRSVYCAEQIAAQLMQTGYEVHLQHLDKPDFS